MAMSVKVLDPALCTGCMACELACSFHHLTAYAPSRSSIEVIRNEKTGEAKITIYRSSQNGHIACDDCGNGKERLCVKYCVRRVIK